MLSTNTGGSDEELVVVTSTAWCSASPGCNASLLRFLCRPGRYSTVHKASQVVLVRDEDRTVLTMANDFKGEKIDEFAIVIPVPTFIEREQIHVANKALIDHLDAYSAPRLVEYFDPNPCEVVVYKEALSAAAP